MEKEKATRRSQASRLINENFNSSNTCITLEYAGQDLPKSMKTINETIAREAVKIAAEIMHDAELCLYEDPASQCPHVWPPQDRTVCDNCIEHWLMEKARMKACPDLTVADKIRSMANDELADFLVRLPEEWPDAMLCLSAYNADKDDVVIPMERCQEYAKKFLEQEVADNGDL